MDTQGALSLNKIHEHYSSSFHNVFKTILNTSLSNQEKRVLIESVSKRYRKSFQDVLTFLLEEYSGALEMFSQENFKGDTSKADMRYRGKGRGGGYTKEARILLERIFEKRKTLNAREREMVAAHCKLTPVQVRVWFNNKRMRSK